LNRVFHMAIEAHATTRVRVWNKTSLSEDEATEITLTTHRKIRPPLHEVAILLKMTVSSADARVQMRSTPTPRADVSECPRSSERQQPNEANRRSKNARAARNEWRGERDKLSLIAEGQQKPADVLGPVSTPPRYQGTLGD
jgi:hypothetical protein